MVKLMNKSEYGRHRGVTHAAVNRAVKSGRISLIDGKIDPNVADIQWAANTKMKLSPANAKALPVAEQINAVPQQQHTGEDYLHWKTRRERAESIRAEQAQELEAGNLVYKDDTQRAAKNAARMMRDQLLSVPARLAGELAAISDTVVIEQKIRSELRSVLIGMDRLLKQKPDEVIDDET
ncbi:hypothetical protein [Methylomonas sp. MgM2]